ncbi:MAG: hypothetical protein WB561_06265 [Terracidiphilus sp.]
MSTALSTTVEVSFFALLGWSPLQEPIQRLIVLLFFLSLPLNASAYAQGSQEGVQFLPELDTHLKLNSRYHLYFEAKDDRDGGDPTQAGIGPSLQLYVKPLIKLKEVTAFDLDDAKPRLLVLEAGYRLLAAPDTPPTNRMLAAVTINLPGGKGLHISDRNRADLNWQSGSFSWRYRNRLTVERTFSARSYHFIPYLAPNPSTRANTRNGAPRLSMPDAYSPWAHMLNSTLTTRTKTIQESTQTTRRPRLG